MAIDFESMENRLKVMKDKTFFIKPGMTITSEEVKGLSRLYKDYSGIYFESCIASFGGNRKGKINLSVEIICTECGEKRYMEMARGSFVEYIKTGIKMCEKCKSELEETRKEKDQVKEKNKENERIEETKKYIDLYLNPNSSWKAEIKIHEKWSIIANQYYIQSMITEHVSDMSYYDYLMTPQWKAISEKKRKQAGFKCQLCNGNGKLSVHHKTYKNKGTEMYNMNDLIVLCDDCHKKFHDIEEN